MIKLFIGQVEMPFKHFLFSGGEVQVQIPANLENPWKHCTIEAKIHNSNDIMILLNLTNAARMLWGGCEIDLILPYVPYSRQDRVCAEGESLALKVFCDIINLQNYNSVTIYDPHSDVTPALLNNCIVKEQWEFIDKIELLQSHVILVSPDTGSLKKIFKVAQKCGFKDVVRADKIRDVATGKITETVVYSEHVGDKDFFIVDDICDGGMTFIQLAKELKKLTTGDIYLYTTHAILSKGFAPLHEAGITHLYTANCWAESVNSDYITIIK